MHRLCNRLARRVSRLYRGELEPENYSCVMNGGLEGFDLKEMEARFDAVAARIEAPVQLVLSNAIKGFLDFAEFNRVAAAEGIFAVGHGMRTAEAATRKTVTVMVPFSDSELSGLDRACAALKITRDEFFVLAVTGKIQHGEAA